MLFADNVKVPVPALVKLPSPEITPEIVSLPLSPVVKVFVADIVILPEPETVLIVSDSCTLYCPVFVICVKSFNAPLTVSVAELLIETDVSEPLTDNVPPDTVVVPV